MKHITYSYETPCVPPRISKYALYSIQVFLVDGLVCVYYDYKCLALLAFLLYTTSIFHWRNIQPYGIYKTMDMICTTTMISYITFVESHSFLEADRQLWITTSMVGIQAYLINKYIEFHQIRNENNVKYLSNEPYTYFSLKYTLPDTPQRDLAYLYSVGVHILFLHMSLSICTIIGIIRSPRPDCSE
jgi:hypothetical protein